MAVLPRHSFYRGDGRQRSWLSRFRPSLWLPLGPHTPWNVYSDPRRLWKRHGCRLGERQWHAIRSNAVLIVIVLPEPAARE